MTKYLAVFADRRMLIILALGFSSGLPLALTAATLQAWLSDAKMNIATIGLFALVGLPYAMKFVWAPFLDRYAFPFLGLRRGWGVVSQLGLFVAISTLAFIDPVTHLGWFSLTALFIAFCSATQDIVVDAYRTELLDQESYGAGAGIYIAGYRGAYVVSAGLALIMADHMSWKLVYLSMAMISLVGVITLLLSPEPNVRRVAKSAGLKETVISPFLEFFQRHGAMEILMFVMIYKLSTLMSVALSTKFLLDLGYSKTLIGSANKVVALAGTVLGTLAGGSLMVKLGMKRALWIFGVVQASVGLTYWALPQVAAMGSGLRESGLIVVIGVDYFMMGMGAAAIMGFMMTVCSQQFTGTQFALLTSLTAVTRVILVAHAGSIVEKIGWEAFYLLTIPLAIPGLLLLLRYDHWQKPSALKKRKIGWLEQSQIFVFMISLLALSSDPLWRWLEMSSLGDEIVLGGACGVIFVIVTGLLKPYLIRAEHPA